MMELLIGPICSGKSTHAAKRAAQGAMIVNDDAIVAAVHGGDYTLYDKKLKPLYKTVEEAIVSQAIVLGKDVVIDRPNMSRAARQRFIGMAQARDVHVVAVMFPNAGPEEHARRRFKSDARGLPLEHWVGAAMRHQRDSDEPLLTEGLVDVCSLEEAQDTLS